VAVPGSKSDALPSPQFTTIDETVPSGSLVEKLTVTVVPARAGFGDTPATVTVGGLSFTVIDDVAWPEEPLLSVAVTVIAKTMEVEPPVLA